MKQLHNVQHWSDQNRSDNFYLSLNIYYDIKYNILYGFLKCIIHV